MNTAALVAVAALLAITFWRPLRHVRHAVGVNHLLASGYAFIALGFAAGLAFDLSNGRPLVAELSPIIAFAAGWIGFGAGGRFEARVLATVPGQAFVRALLPAVAAALAVGAAAAIALWHAGALPHQVHAGALILAAAAASAGPTLAAVMRTRRARRSPEAAAALRMIEFSAGIADGLVVVLALAAFALFHTDAAISAYAVAGGAALGGAMWLFLGGRANEDEHLLLGLAMLAMIGGLGGWLEVSPTALGAVAGVALGNLPGERARAITRAVRRVERPVVVILMTVAGVSIAGPVSWYVVPLVVAMTGVRLGAKALAAGPVQPSLPQARNLGVPTGWTLGLAPQGILGLVVALSFLGVWPSTTARTILAAIALAGLLNEVAAPALLARCLRRIGGNTGSHPAVGGPGQ